MSKFLYDKAEIINLKKEWEAQGLSVVVTNGCFDIIHVGHVTLLEKAKSLGDKLIVAINSDESVKRLKGETRPVNSLEARAKVLSAIRYVDAVTFFEEDTPFELYKDLRPHILVKGGDYKAEDVIGREFSKKVVIIPFVPGYSTTNILSR